MSAPTTRDRVLDCFRAVFPSVPDDQLLRASAGKLPAWDSIAQVTLLSVIEEDLGVTFSLDRHEHLTSFDAILSELEGSGR